MSDLDDKTKVPLFALLTAMPFFVAAILWMASVDSKASEAKDALSDIRARLIRIEDKLNQ